MRTSSERRAAHGQGLFAERFAAGFLRLNLYSILVCRYHVRGGEIDIIARRGDDIIFVEVKVRPTLDEARTSIDAVKRRRISRAARSWLAANPWAAPLALRGDAVFLAPWRWPSHVRGAFELDLD